jgi:putative transposase
MTTRSTIILGSLADKVSPESFFNLLKRERIRRRT